MPGISAAESNPACVGMNVYTHACVYLCVCVCTCVCFDIGPSVHTNTPFSTGHLTHFSVWITILQPITDRRNDECCKKSLHPACHTSEFQSCLSTESEAGMEREKREREKERKKELLILSSLPSFLLLDLHHKETSKTITHPPQLQLKVALHQWLRFLYIVLWKGRRKKKPATSRLRGCFLQKDVLFLHATCRLQHYTVFYVCCMNAIDALRQKKEKKPNTLSVFYFLDEFHFHGTQQDNLRLKNWNCAGHLINSPAVCFSLMATLDIHLKALNSQLIKPLQCIWIFPPVHKNDFKHFNIQRETVHLSVYTGNNSTQWLLIG